MIPFASCSHTKKKKSEDENLERKPTLEHKALSRSDSILYAKYQQSRGKPLETGVHHHMSDCFDLRPDILLKESSSGAQH